MWKKSNEPGQPILEVTHYMNHLILDFLCLEWCQITFIHLSTALYRFEALFLTLHP